MMIIFGITGGSGSGKTSASAMLAELGVDIIDTDAIAHKITEPNGECIKELECCFGSGIINADGTLDRKKLASIAFSDGEKTKLLNSITHKYIKQSVLERISNSNAKLAAIDGAVIIGSNIEPLCEFIVSVLADYEVRLARIIARDKLTAAQAKQRLDAQPDEDFYKAHSRYIIRNNADENELRKEVINLYNEINEVEF